MKVAGRLTPYAGELRALGKGARKGKRHARAGRRVVILAGWLPRYPPRGRTPAPIFVPPPTGFPGEKLAGASFWMGVCRNGIANAGASAASHPPA